MNATTQAAIYDFDHLAELSFDPVSSSMDELEQLIGEERLPGKESIASFLSGVRFARISLAGAIPEVRKAGVAN